MSHITAILDYIVDSFIHIWPYLLITIPIAVAVQMSGAAKYINRAFTARPLIAIVLATAVGAFSPLCSCSVVPVVAAMLIGGVPLAPVMSFWLASPSMDPEIFFLTVSSLGWELAIWRLAATLSLSLGGGYVTQLLVQRDWLGANFLRMNQSTQTRTLSQFFREGLHNFRMKLADLWNPNLELANAALHAEAIGCCDVSSEPNLVQISSEQFNHPLRLSASQTEPSSCDE